MQSGAWSELNPALCSVKHHKHSSVAALSCPVLSCAVLCCPVLCCPVLCCAVLSCAVLYCPHHSPREPCTVLAKLGSQATTQHGCVICVTMWFVSLLPAKPQHTMVTERSLFLCVKDCVTERTLTVPLCQRLCHRENSYCSFVSKTMSQRERSLFHCVKDCHIQRSLVQYTAV